MFPEDFKRYLSIERNYSSHTVDAYLRDIRQFHTFLLEHYDIDISNVREADKLSHKRLRAWMGELLSAGMSRRSVARKLATVSTWYKFLMKTGQATRNPATRVRAPKLEKKLPQFLKESETENLFARVEWDPGFEGQRDRCLLEVLYGCGLRRSELIGLEYGNIDLRARTLRVMGKGRKERVVPFGRPVAEAMESYMEQAEHEGLNYRAAFFVKKDGKPLYPRLVHRIVERCIQTVSDLQKKSPHVLRHTFATHLLSRGADLNAIKELLGHNSLAATQVYVHHNISKLKEVYKQAHPRA